MTRFFFRLFCLITLGISIAAFSDQPIPELSGRVVDETGLLTRAEQNTLELKLDRLERDQGSQVAVLIVNSTKPESIAQYSIRVAEQWKLGRADVDDGILLLIAKDDRKFRIEVGYGLEGAVTDYDSKIILDQYMMPQFKSGNYYDGITQAVDLLTILIKGEDLPAPETTYGPSNAVNSESQIPVLTMIACFLMPVFIVLGHLVKKKPLRLIFPVIMFALIYFSSGLIGLGVVMSAFVLIGVYAAGQGGLGGGGSSRRHYGGGFGGGSSSGGFGGGGFSGGGGGFGGGGASGGW